MNLKITAFTAVLLLAGCASLPDDVAVAQPENLPTFAQVKESPQSYSGQEVVFGGNIVEVNNGADTTTVELLQLPLYSSGRPKPDASRSQGRLRVTFETFLDPEIFTKGRQLTVRGTVTGTEKGSIGDHPYTFVSIKGTGLYLWREQDDEVEVHYIMGINGFYPYGYPVRARKAPVKKP